ncbi:MAG: PTS sugar transporter [Lactobacillus sp.]|nr:PTS sugar transporter [Lactobacillus sp.]
MTIEELKKGYENEIAYQKLMLRNLSYYFELAILITAIGIVMTYYFWGKSQPALILGIVIIVIGILMMLVIGTGAVRGRKNLNLVIQDYHKKLKK